MYVKSTAISGNKLVNGANSVTFIGGLVRFGRGRSHRRENTRRPRLFHTNRQSKLQLFTGKGAMQASPLHSAPPPPLRGSARGRTSVSEAWECDGEATALTQLAVDLNLPPVLLRDALRNGEAQARTWSEARIFC